MPNMALSPEELKDIAASSEFREHAFMLISAAIWRNEATHCAESSSAESAR
jgi:hypothetical protein